MMIELHLLPNNLASAMEMMRRRESIKVRLKNMTEVLFALAMPDSSLYYCQELVLQPLLSPIGFGLCKPLLYL